MKLDKLTEQLSGRQQGLQAVFPNAQVAADVPSAVTPPPSPPAAAPARRNRKQVEGSKRSTWKMRAWYVQPETASRLTAYVNRQQEGGKQIDASEVVDKAIAAWLNRQGA